MDKNRYYQIRIRKC